jgi:hypothetical protein
MYDVLLDGVLVRTSPAGMREERVRALVEEAVVELGVRGVVEIRPHIVVPAKRYPQSNKRKGVMASLPQLR